MRIRFRDMREDHDLKQHQVAEYLHCDQSDYSKYERGQRAMPLRHLIQLALLYHTSIDYLAGLTDEPVPYPRKEEKEE